MALSRLPDATPRPQVGAPLDLSLRPGVEIPAAVLDFLAAETAALLVGPLAERSAARRRLQEVVRLTQIPLTLHGKERRRRRTASEHLVRAVTPAPGSGAHG